MNFFLDNTFGPPITRALAIVAGPRGHAFTHMLDIWPEGDPGDLVWIPALAAKPGDWIVLSGDRNIAKNPQRQAALRTAGLTAFFMPRGFPREDRLAQAAWLFQAFPEIVVRAQTAKRGEGFRLRENRKAERIP